jgi:hypothetical protein
MSFLTDLVTNFSDYEELIAQSNKEVSERKFNGLLEGNYGYVKDLTAAREFNELLVERGNPKPIERKLKSLTLGGIKVRITLESRGYQFPTADVRYVYEIVPLYGDVKDLTTARKLNELLIDRGDPEAIARKMMGLECEEYGYSYSKKT